MVPLKPLGSPTTAIAVPEVKTPLTKAGKLREIPLSTLDGEKALAAPKTVKIEGKPEAKLDNKPSSKTDSAQTKNAESAAAKKAASAKTQEGHSFCSEAEQWIGSAASSNNAHRHGCFGYVRSACRLSFHERSRGPVRKSFQCVSMNSIQ